MHKLIYTLLFAYSIVFGQQINFFREDITFRLDGDYFRIEGFYWFSNRSDRAVTSEIYFPFPPHSGGRVDSIQIYDLTKGRETWTREEEFGLAFIVHLEPADTSLFRIKYRQKLNSDSAVYILKTTKNWGKPLAVAEFKLIIPDSFVIKGFSYPPDQLYEIEKIKIYLWKREQFLPDRNMVFYF